MGEPPSSQLEELKTFLFTYIIMAPLLSALFADRIDNFFVVCLLFVVLVGGSYIFVRKRLDKIEESIRELETKWEEDISQQP